MMTRRSLVGTSIFLGFGCLIYAALSDFIPSQSWMQIGTVCVVVLAIGYNASVFLAYRPLQVEKSRRASATMIVAGYGFLQLILIAFFWPAVIYAGAGIFTSATGAQ